MLECPGAIDKIFRYLRIENDTLRREACSILANICTGTPHQIEQVFAEPRYIREMIQVALHDKRDVTN